MDNNIILVGISSISLIVTSLVILVVYLALTEPVAETIKDPATSSSVEAPGCEYNDWGNWSMPDASGNAKRTKTRKSTSPSTCTTLEEVKACGYNEWSPWTAPDENGKISRTQTKTAESPDTCPEKKEEGFKGALIKHTKTGKCLDADGKIAYFGTCSKTNPFMAWEYTGNTLRHPRSSKCLDGDGSKVYLNSCSETNPFMAWERKGTRFVHKNSGNCLDGDGKKVYLTACNDGNEFMSWSN